LTAFFGVLVGLFLSKLKTPPEQPVNSIAPRGQSTNENEEAKELASFHSHLPGTPQTKDESCKCCHHKTPFWKWVVDWGMLVSTTGAFVAASVYASISYRQWQEQIKSGRPWIYAEKLDMTAVYGPSLILNNAGSSAGIVHEPRFAYFRLYKPQMQFWYKNDPIPEDICEKSRSDERFKFPVFPKIPFAKDIRVGYIPRVNETLTGTPRTIVGCIAYYGTKGEGPYYTKFVYYVERNSDDTVKSTTLMDSAVE
jgi:hypothetical protein